jgi:hypothetical protein
MAKDTATNFTSDATAVATAEAVADVEFPLTVVEYCTHLSATDRRVELIGAFEHSERVAGRSSDIASNFSRRYAAFVNQPA